jgi:hypothetical protein
MKIPKWITHESEVLVDVTATDVAQMLRGDPQSVETALEGLNNIACFLKGMPDSVIELMSAPQKKVIADFLAGQAKRFVASKPEEQEAVLDVMP